jgi:hypothetical protein
MFERPIITMRNGHVKGVPSALQNLDAAALERGASRLSARPGARLEQPWPGPAARATNRLAPSGRLR